MYLMRWTQGAFRGMPQEVTISAYSLQNIPGLSTGADWITHSPSDTHIPQ